MRPLPIFLGCFLLSFPAFCQFRNPTVRVSANYPYIANVTQNLEQPTASPGTTGYTVRVTSVGAIKERYDSKPGFDVSFNFDVVSHAKFFVRTGLSLQYYSYKRHIGLVRNDDLDDLIGDLRVIPCVTCGIDTSQYGVIYGTNVQDETDGTLIDRTTGLSLVDFEPTPPDPKIGQTSVLFLQVPVMLGKTFFKSKLRIQVGAAASVLLQATQYKEFYSFSYYGAHTYEVRKEKTSDGFTNFMVNGLFETSYAITKRLGVTLNGQRSFAPIYDAGNRPAGKAVFNSFSFGASYQVGKLIQ